MAKDDIHVLLVEDDEEDYLYTRHLLSESKMCRYEVTWADRLAVALNYLTDSRVDVILLDLTLPDSYGMETFTTIRKQVPGVPVVLLTGLHDEDLATRAVHAGAQDYLSKNELSFELLSRSINYAIERLRAQETLQSAYKDLECLITERTQKLAQTTQRLQIEIARRERLEHALKEGRHVESICAFVESATHRFGKLLNGIRDGVEALSSAEGGAHGGAGRIDEIMAAANRAGDISSSLAGLTKAVGTGESKLDRFSASRAIREIAEQLGATLEKRGIRLSWSETGPVKSVHVDAAQFVEIVSLFVANAPHVLGEGGEVRLRLVECAELPDKLAGADCPPDAKFAVLEVFYSGVLLDESAVDSILNPIAGLGAELAESVPPGVGLAVVQSRSRGWGGNVQVLAQGEYGGGFRVFLPIYDAASMDRSGVPSALVKGDPVLVVDDDAAYVTLVTGALTDAGYGVVSASTGTDALRLLAGNAVAPSAAVIDATLAGGKSLELLKTLCPEGRDIPVLMVSGFSRDYLHGLLPRGNWHFLQKPFAGEELSAMVNGLVRAHSSPV